MPQYVPATLIGLSAWVPRCHGLSNTNLPWPDCAIRFLIRNWRGLSPSSVLSLGSITPVAAAFEAADDLR